MTARRFWMCLIAIALLAVALRAVYPAADPPWRTTVGVVWHDEGAWVHNARNKALFGRWREDEWNPMYIAPVFTGLEYLSFAAFGVGVRQARLVSELAGVGSVVLLALGVRRIGGSAAGLIAGGLLATNYVYVMYDRAAIMEALMVAFIVASWYCSVRAQERPAWGALAGVMAVLAFFTKAAAAFYLGALGLGAVIQFLPPEGGSHVNDRERRGVRVNDRAQGGGDESDARRAALWTVAGLAITFGVIAAVFVLPNWSEYRFYNWQMSVTRKPSYTVKAIVDRVSWFPVLHDTFTRMWFEVAVGVVGAWGLLLRWRARRTAERLLVLWLVVGTLELLVHDVGNERRFVFLIPALIAITSLVLGRSAGLLPDEAARIPRRRAWMAAPVILYTAYVLVGPIARLPFLYVVRDSVRLSAVLALALGLVVVSTWPRAARLLSRGGWALLAAAGLTGAIMTADLVQFVQWASIRTYKNYEASRAIGRILPEGTLVHGKLANGLALENRIKPVFVGHGFGNFADRKRRDDVRYILTYIEPSPGYEGSQIEDVLDAYPHRRIIMTFDVAETPSGHDRAALIDKRARD
jgi:4-amino-4-deoxy-L-arabinose transferase-like glycosyltransferase